jgi:hypothetical protein
MTESALSPGQIAIIVLPSVLTLLAAVVAAVHAILAHRETKISSAEIQKLHAALIESTGRRARAEGVIAGIAVERDRADDLASHPPAPPGFVADTRASG